MMLAALLSIGSWLLFDKIGHYVAISLIVLVSLFFTYEHIKGVGYAECKAKWEAAELAIIKKGNDARSDAERDVSGGLRDDGYDRDKH